MKITETKVSDFMKNFPRFVIPIYQRIYSSTDQQCWQL